MEITPVLPIGGQKFPRYFEGYLKFFAVFKDFYVFIPRFLAESPMTFRGTLPWKRCLNLWHLTHNVVRVETFFNSSSAIERKDLLCLKITENICHMFSVIRLYDVYRDGFTFAAKLDGILKGFSSLIPY